MEHGGRVDVEPLLAGGRRAGVLVWGSLLGLLYLLVMPAWQPLGVAAPGCVLIAAGVLRAVLRLGTAGSDGCRRPGARPSGGRATDVAETPTQRTPAYRSRPACDLTRGRDGRDRACVGGSLQGRS